MTYKDMMLKTSHRFKLRCCVALTAWLALPATVQASDAIYDQAAFDNGVVMLSLYADIEDTRELARAIAIVANEPLLKKGCGFGRPLFQFDFFPLTTRGIPESSWDSVIVLAAIYRSRSWEHIQNNIKIMGTEYVCREFAKDWDILDQFDPEKIDIEWQEIALD